MRSQRVVKPFEPAKERLRAKLSPGERVLAEGRADERDRTTGDLYTGGHTIVLVTDRRLLWRDASLPFHAIRRYRSGMQHHRWAVLLEHRPIDRERAAPYRVLWVRWGRRTVTRRVGRTILGFSRADTACARAIRERLEAFDVPHGAPLVVPPTPPQPGASAVLQAIRVDGARATEP